MATSTSVAIALLVLVAVANSASASITCRTVISTIRPCYKYVAGEEERLNPACCRGIRFLKGAASSTQDRRATCRCLKQLVKYAHRAAALPQECGVSVSYPISPSVNCNAIA